MDLWEKARQLAELMLDQEAVVTDEPAAPAVAAKPRIQVYMGGRVSIAMMQKALGLPTIGDRMVKWAEAKIELRVGATCDHCRGKGRYGFHTDSSRNDKCFRCHGKGIIDERDMGFINRRRDRGEPLSLVVSA
jgi:hypothetical protein